MGYLFTFLARVWGYVASGLQWDKFVANMHEFNEQSKSSKHGTSVFKINFKTIRKSYFPDNVTYASLLGQGYTGCDKHGSSNDYAHTYIEVDNISPFILRKDQEITIRSISGSNKSKFDGVKMLVVMGYAYDRRTGCYFIVDNNHANRDHDGTPGVLAVSICGTTCGFENTGLPATNETGKAYILAPGTKPNAITQMQVFLLWVMKNWKISAAVLIVLITLIYTLRK